MQRNSKPFNVKNLLGSFGALVNKNSDQDAFVRKSPDNGNGRSTPPNRGNGSGNGSSADPPDASLVQKKELGELSAGEGGIVESNPAYADNSNGEGVIRKIQPLRLIQILVQKGNVPHEKIEQAFEIQKKNNDKRRLIDILVEDLEVDRETIYQAIADYYSFESVDPTAIFGSKDKLQFIRQLLESLPPYFYELAVRRKILPYELYTNGHDKLIVMTPDTTHPDVHTVARAFQFQKYEIKYTSLANWNELWRQLAFDGGIKQMGLDVEEEFMELSTDESEKGLEQSLEDEIGRGKLNEMIESILIDGVRTGASDIHIIPKSMNRTEFHFRIDGKLSLWSALTDIRSEAVITVIKDRARNLDRFEKFLSQDGFAQRLIDNKMIRFRFSTMPIYCADLRAKLESIVIRILRGSDDSLGLHTLGMMPATRNVFLNSIRKPQGIIIFTGPTGSGKTTSQHAAIKEIMDPGINIITIEDPVEYLIEGVRQVKLNHKLDFEGALRGLLRHDPDVVMVGEMRDKISADIAVKLANTGHLIFSTLHTNDSVSAITRLYNMGIEPFLLAYTINLVVAQRLVRKLCDRCKMIDEDIDKEFLRSVGFSEQEISETKFYKAVGCAQCIKGYRGRIGLFEALHMTKEMRKIILKSRDFIDEEALRTLAVQNGMITLRDAAKNLVIDGVTSLETVEGMMLDE